MTDATADINRKPDISEIVSICTEYDIRGKNPLMVEAYLTFPFYLIRHSISKNGKLQVANIDQVNDLFDKFQNHKASLQKLCDLADDVLFEQTNTVVGDASESRDVSSEQMPWTSSSRFAKSEKKTKSDLSLLKVW